MPRNMSFALTTEQICNRTKTVTRRVGWDFLKPGDIVNACVKIGLAPGERAQRLAQIRIVRTRIEPLSWMMKRPEYGASEAAREGFPGWTGEQFVELFMKHMTAELSADTLVNRIEFEYVEPEQWATEFRIDRPGVYRNRSGKNVFLWPTLSHGHKDWMEIATLDAGTAYFSNGQFWSTHGHFAEWDIVAYVGPLPAEILQRMREALVLAEEPPQ